MQINIFFSLKEAIESFAEPDKEYDFVMHRLANGEEIEVHYHEQEEWVIIDEGKVEIAAIQNGHVQTHTLEPYDENDETTVDKLFLINIPSQKKHSLKALTEICYMVYKTKIPIKQIKGVIQG
jgi:hypothetical protein